VNGETIAQVAGYLGVGAIAVAIISGLFTRRKVAADASGAIATAAASLVQPLSAQVTAQNAELMALRLELAKERRERSTESEEYLDRLYEIDQAAQKSREAAEKAARRVNDLSQELSACHRQYDALAVMVAELQRNQVREDGLEGTG